MNIFDLFKKPEPKVQAKTVIKTKIVEKIVPKESRFTFAHDDSVVVKTYHFNINGVVQLSDYYKPGARFIIYGGYNFTDKSTVYPVFQLPDALPNNGRIVSMKKIICIGAVYVFKNDSEIYCISDEFTGINMEELNTRFCNDPITKNSCILPAIRSNIIVDKVCNNDSIDFDLLRNSIIIDSKINMITNE